MAGAARFESDAATAQAASAAAPSKPPRIAHTGGVITSNKPEAMRRFILRLLRSGATPTADQRRTATDLGLVLEELEAEAKDEAALAREAEKERLRERLRAAEASRAARGASGGGRGGGRARGRGRARGADRAGAGTPPAQPIRLSRTVIWFVVAAGKRGAAEVGGSGKETEAAKRRKLDEELSSLAPQSNPL